MKLNRRFTHSNSVLSPLRIAITAALVTAAAAMAFVATKTSNPVSAPDARPLVLKKGGRDAKEPGANKRVMIGANEFRAADYTPDVEAYLLRAYPAAEVSMQATLNAQNGWKALNAKQHSAGSWQLIGPSQASVPGVLNALGDFAPYITAGRVTAMALAPNCGQGKCRLYVAAAGGGIWRTDKAKHTNPSQKWEFISGSFATNAIGSLIIDPNDPSGNTLYVGTGEPNVSADSEAGMGVYKSTNGGDTWTLLPGSVAPASNFQGRAVSSIATNPSGHIFVGIARAVRGVSSVSSGGATSNPPPATNPAAFGVYRSTNGGATFTNIFAGDGSVRGINQVAVDPNTPTTLYASSLGKGVYRSTDNGATWTQIQAASNGADNTDRSEFALNKLPAGKTRMYLGQGSASQTPQSRFLRTDDAAGAAAFANMTTPQVENYCTGQCWYDNIVYSPAGYPNIVYVMGSFDYFQILAFGSGKSNGRAVLLSSDSGATWSDLTQDSDATNAEFTHPDAHAIVTLPENPYEYWQGSDGGIILSDGAFADVSYKCDQRGLNAADTAYCKSLLWRVPRQLANNINKGFSTLQFQSLSVSAQHPLSLLQGGTQDNGTWGFTGSSTVWNQIIYGDGGQSGFSSANEALRFNTFTGQASDVNFQNGDPTKWVIATGPIVSSPEASYFYPPITADPNPARGGTIFQGSFSVWRTQNWGGNQAFLEANCPEFTTSAADPTCGDFVTIGPPGNTDLTDVGYGTDRLFGAVAAIERAPSNTGTIWVATGTGRVFFSSNADAAASSVVWERLDTSSAADPGRFVSSIYVDPANPNHAWISYSGYNFNTVSQPGHVFDVLRTGPSTATWTDISYNLPDLPATDLVRDDVRGDLYAASDFGVMKLPNATTTWAVAGTGLPMVEVPGLTIVPSARILYAATHGRSAWSLKLP